MELIREILNAEAGGANFSGPAGCGGKGRKEFAPPSGITCREARGRVKVAGQMDKLFEELDFRETPIGDLILQRRKYLQLDGQVVYEVKLGDAFLMSSMFHVVEVALSKLGLAALDGEGWDVVVGGLGLGYTAVAALEFPQVKELLVVDAMEGVIDWHERELVPLGKTMNDDPRCRYVLGDFFALAADPDKGFDPETAGEEISRGAAGYRSLAIESVRSAQRDFLHAGGLGENGGAVASRRGVRAVVGRCAACGLHRGFGECFCEGGGAHRRV